MADLENRRELSSSSSPSSAVATKPFFNRSMTFTAALEPTVTKKAHHALEHAGSLKKFYTSFETVRSASNSFKGKVKKLCSFFETTTAAADKLRLSRSMAPDFRILSIRLPGTDDRIVMYLTSLRGIRRTYEDCYAVKTIFRGFGVWVDERDISMDSAYRIELQSVLGAKNVSLPQVFIKGKYVGGAEVIKQLFETGELEKILQGLPVRKPGFVCEVCGDARFVPCTNCGGSRKVFDEDDGMLKRCNECNENGLIRCPDCCS